MLYFFGNFDQFAANFEISVFRPAPCHFLADFFERGVKLLRKTCCRYYTCIAFETSPSPLYSPPLLWPKSDHKKLLWNILQTIIAGVIWKWGVLYCILFQSLFFLLYNATFNICNNIASSRAEILHLRGGSGVEVMGSAWSKCAKSWPCRSIHRTAYYWLTLIICNAVLIWLVLLHRPFGTFTSWPSPRQALPPLSSIRGGWPRSVM